jgi:predicted N-acyltransferase
VKTDTRIISDFSTIDERDWEQLGHEDNPFLSRAFLHALEASGSVNPATGWQAHHLAIFQDGQLAAFAPTYAKTHSHGEFVFDWAWADAYARNGLNYYPKLLTAIPYSPVSGPRLLSRNSKAGSKALRQMLLELAKDECRRLDYSSWHCNFTTGPDEIVLEPADLLKRRDLQFHWFNRGYRSFDEFLQQLRSRKRKNIRRERRQVQEAGIQFEWKTGRELTAGDLDFLYRCYCNTFRAHGNHAALRPEFFRMLAAGLGDRMHMSIASRQETPVAMGMFLSGGGRLYGRYWGCIDEIPGLHFETAYYQGIEYCIEHGIDVFESGAQGEHKISRGFVPAKTASYHLIRHEAFRAAIGDALQRESEWLDRYRVELARHDPYRRDTQ